MTTSVALSLAAGAAWAQENLPQFLTAAIEICNDVAKPSATRIAELSDAGWTQVANSDRVLDLWTQSTLATRVMAPMAHGERVELFKKWRARAGDWVKNRTERKPPIALLAHAIERVESGTVGILVEHSEWPGLLELEMRWTSAAGGVDAQSCKFLSEDTLPETVLEIGPPANAPEVVYMSKDGAHTYKRTDLLIAATDDSPRQILRGYFAMSDPHWEDFVSDVRLKTLLIVNLDPLR